MIVPFEKAQIVGPNSVSVVTVRTLGVGDPGCESVPNRVTLPSSFFLGFFRIDAGVDVEAEPVVCIKYMTGGASLAPEIAKTPGASRSEMAPQTASAKQVVHQIVFRVRRLRDLFQAVDGSRGVLERSFFLTTEHVSGLIDYPGGGGHQGTSYPFHLIPMAGTATLLSVIQGGRIRNEFVVRFRQGVGLVVSSMAVGTGKSVAGTDLFHVLVAGSASVYRTPCRSQSGNDE